MVDPREKIRRFPPSSKWKKAKNSISPTFWVHEQTIKILPNLDNIWIPPPSQKKHFKNVLGRKQKKKCLKLLSSPPPPTKWCLESATEWEPRKRECKRPKTLEIIKFSGHQNRLFWKFWFFAYTLTPCHSINMSHEMRIWLCDFTLLYIISSNT